MQATLLGTILVVEDIPSELELMVHYLRDSGCNVISAITAQEAMEKAAKYRPNVIVTDIVMPGVSGFELCRNLKKHPETAHVPIIICTSKDQDIDRLWGLKQGANVYLTKPYTRDQLVQAVMTVMRSY
jgi:twitching motility two-component system response regulator PilH